MARSENRIGTKSLKLSTTPEVCRFLDELAKTGLFGKTPTEVAEELLRRAVRESISEGWVKGTRSKKSNDFGAQGGRKRSEK